MRVIKSKRVGEYDWKARVGFYAAGRLFELLAHVVFLFTCSQKNAL